MPALSIQHVHLLWGRILRVGGRLQKPAIPWHANIIRQWLPYNRGGRVGSVSSQTTGCPFGRLLGGMPGRPMYVHQEYSGVAFCPGAHTYAVDGSGWVSWQLNPRHPLHAQQHNQFRGRHCNIQLHMHTQRTDSACKQRSVSACTWWHWAPAGSSPCSTVFAAGTLVPSSSTGEQWHGSQVLADEETGSLRCQHLGSWRAWSWRVVQGACTRCVQGTVCCGDLGLCNVN
jgi:hypothetical protein